MTTIAKLAFACCAVASCAGFAAAQDEAGSAQIVLTPHSSLFDKMQAREATRAAKIRKEWLAEGHAPAPGADPTISAGKILTSNLNAARQPAAPEYSVTFKTGPSGLAYVSAYFYSPDGKQFVYVDYGPPSHSPPVTSGSLKISQPGYGYEEGMLNPYSESGNWMLEEVYIYDRASNETVYGEQQLPTLFPSTTIAVTNDAKPDATAPIISAGKIVTQTVKLSSPDPLFRTELTVSDNLSGVHSVAVWVLPPGGSEAMSGFTDLPAPVTSGKVSVSNYLGASPKRGTWTIDETEICDVATNCVYDSDASDLKALFGTLTFKVKD